MPFWVDRTRRLRRHLSSLEVWELERFGRTGLGIVTRQPLAVLTTTGRRSGLPRKTPVAVTPFAGGYLLGGGAGGQTATPDWVFNLRATPLATLTFGPEDSRTMTVEEPIGTTRDAAHAHLLSTYPSARRYEEWSGRPLPLFLLRPTDE
jgi:deazaflavin-dependent oxidoreductase (nitroreductase family)